MKAYLLLINDYVELAGTRTEDVRRLRIERKLFSWCSCQYDCSGEEGKEKRRGGSTNMHSNRENERVVFEV